MKKLIIGLLTLGVLACQHHAAPVVRVAAAPLPVAAVMPAVAPPLAAPAAAPDSLTPAMQTMLRQFDLSPLWVGDTAYADGYPVLTGFFGPDHYGISLIIDHAERDAREPALFHVRGRDRFRKVITPFEGTIRVRQIADFDSSYIMRSTIKDSVKVYTATAAFTLRQAPTGKQYGVFSGEAFVDFYVTNDGYYRAPEVLMEGIIDTNTPTLGSGRLLRGTWVNSLTGAKKPLLVAADVFVIAPEIFPDFGVGDRGTQVNPKYAKLGWSELWENEEWWAESPKLSLNL